MKNELIHFERINRADWQRLHKQATPPLTLDELDSIKSLNDKISLKDVREVYLPLTQLIQIYKKAKEDLSFSKSIFLQEKVRKQPFIIGISGSVAVGKSTTSRLLQLLLKRTQPNATVELVTTDGFLYPNHILEKKGIMNRKGFPESYHMEGLLHFLDQLKNMQSTRIPVYSHESYDILPHHQQTVTAGDFVIIEGINVFQNPQNHHLYMTDYFDFSIYVDAHVAHIEKWYLERFAQLLDLAKHNPKNYYYRFTLESRTNVMHMAKNVWNTINLPNLQDYIEPTKNRAEMILHKSENHQIDTIYLKK